MFWRLITICLSVYFLLFAAPVRAEKSEYKEGEAAVKGLLFGAQDIFVELHGFLNVEAYNFQSGASSSRRIPSFDLHNFYLSAKAQPAKGFTAFAEVEYEHGTEQIKIDRAFIDWEAFTWGTIRI
ncbi:MAG TPA: hypothetical protein VI382_02200, partial [Candidatus Manganitrophaceae bacterium]|nr:hypothetical protein [Candidatus Manganitrophaceae bacterium]